jgi:hypothetical protein
MMAAIHLQSLLRKNSVCKSSQVVLKMNLRMPTKGLMRIDPWQLAVSDRTTSVAFEMATQCTRRLKFSDEIHTVHTIINTGHRQQTESERSVRRLSLRAFFVLSLDCVQILALQPNCCLCDPMVILQTMVTDACRSWW